MGMTGFRRNSGCRKVLAWILILAVAMSGLGVDRSWLPVQASGAYTTLYIVDDTREHWLGNDNAVIELVDNTCGHDHYVMTKVSATTWSVRVPASTYNVTFNRLNPEMTAQWNSWSARGRDSHDTYHAQGHEYGYWGGEAVYEGGEEREYLPPAADFTLNLSWYQRDPGGTARIAVHNHASSPDGDALKEVSYTIYRDRNGDGSFSDDEAVCQKALMDAEWIYETTGVGEYQVVQKVREEVPPELQEAGYDAARIEELTVSECTRTFTVGNVKPEPGLSIHKKNSVDLLFTFQGLDGQQAEAYRQKGEQIAGQLRDDGIDVTAEWQELEQQERLDHFTWETYAHEQYVEPDPEAPERHVETGDDYAVFTGYGEKNFKDFAYSDPGEAYRELSFTVQQSGNDGIEGAGMLFGAGIGVREEGDSFHGHTYRLYEPGRTWSQAEIFCEEQGGGYLATITSMEEYEYVTSHVLDGTQYSMYWLGGCKTEENGIRKWGWVSGEEFDYTRWAAGEPNTPGESVIEMYGSYGPEGFWNDTLDNPGTGWEYGYDRVGTLCEWNGSEISGYALLLTGQGMKLIRLEHTDLYNLQNGSYPYLENAGTLLGTFAYDTALDEHRMTLLFDGDRVTIRDNGAVITEDFPLGREMEGTGIAPVVSYTKHQAGTEASESGAAVRDIVLSRNSGMTLKECMDGHTWRNGAQHMVACFAGSRMPEFGRQGGIADCICSLYQMEGSFLGIGSDANQEAWKMITDAVEEGFTDYSEQKLEHLGTGIRQICEDRDLEIGTYITTDDVLLYEGVYQDAENDPVYRQYWEYDYVVQGQEETMHREEEAPVTQFDTPGAYTIRLRVQDNPVGDNDALGSYRLWSDEHTYERLLLVQSRPAAEIEVSAADNSGDQCIVNTIYRAEDPDHPEDARKGIRQELFSYKKLEDPAWTEGRLPNKVDRDAVYLVRYQVRDVDGCQSEPVVEVLDTAGPASQTEVPDTLDPELLLKANKSTVALGDSVRIEGYAWDDRGIGQFGLYINDRLVQDHIGMVTYSPGTEGTVTVRAEAVDLSGNRTEKSLKLEVCERAVQKQEKNDCPELAFGEVRFNEDHSELEITGTVTDDTGLKEYRLTCRDRNGEEIPAGGGTEPVPEMAVLGRIDTANLESGEYEAELTAEDGTGNTSTLYITITYSAAARTIEGSVENEADGCPEITFGEVRFSADRSKLEITGSITDDTGLVRYALTYRGSNGEDLTAGEGTGEVPKTAVLGQIDTEGLENGEHIVECRAEDRSGNTSTLYITIFYTGTGQKPGTQTQTDMKRGNGQGDTVPEGTFGITVTPVRAAVGTSATIQAVIPEGMDASTLTVKNGDTVVQMQGLSGTFAAETAGTCILTAAVLDAEGQEHRAETTFQAYDASDRTPPQIRITAPEADAVLKGVTDITGSVMDDKGMDSYTLEYAMEGSGDYILLAEGKEAGENAVLGQLDTTMLRNGRYVLRIRARDKSGNTGTLERSVTVEGTLKVGAMNIGFTDLTASLEGTTVSVNRMYDSRNKTQGDFGTGWTLGLQGVELMEGSPLEEGISMVQSGSLFSTVYQMTETASHDVVVTYGDGTSDRFELTFSPERRALLPISEVKLGYRCVTSQRVKLEILGDATALVSGEGLYFEDEAMYGGLSYKLTTAEGTGIYLRKGTGVYKITGSGGSVITVDKNGYHGADGKGIVFTRDGRGRITRAEDPAGSAMQYHYDLAGDLTGVTDQAGRTASFTYDDDHNLLSVTDPSGIAVSRNEYDEEGRLTATIDADGNRTEYTHDVEGRTETVKDRLGNTTVYVYDNSGNILSRTDANGNTVKSTYDSYGNELTRTDAKGNVTGCTYDDAGNLTTVTDADGNVLKNTYNAGNRIISMKTVDDTEILIDYDQKGNLSSTTDAEGNTVTYTNDSRGNITGIADGIGTVMTAKYDGNGNVVETQDSAGNRTVNTYDAEGNRLTAVKQNNGSLTQYTYDQTGNLTGITDAAGNTTTYAYDAASRRTRTTLADGSVSTSEYDGYGLLSASTDYKGIRTTYTYDAEDHLTGQTTGNSSVEYAYDTLGRLKDIKAGDNHITYGYNEYGELAAKTYENGQKITYTYDQYGRTARITVLQGGGNPHIYRV